jgi:chromosomal replication initiator protein
MTDQLWGTLREELKSTLGRNNFTTWIEPLELTHLDGGVATFSAPSNFVGNWVNRNFAEHIRSLFQENGELVDRL